MCYMNEFETRVLDGIQDLAERMVRVETKLDRIDLHELRIGALEKETPSPDHEVRIRKLERMVWIATGLAAASSGVLSAAITQLAGGG